MVDSTDATVVPGGPDPGQVLVAGDWHGNQDWAAKCLRMATDRGCPVVLQLGDFGLWPGREDEWLDFLDAQARDAGVELLWVDGNHENHDSLGRWKAAADRRGLVRMRPRVTWATRGARWEWSGRRFGAMGGAVSIDRFLRRSGSNWWPQEAPSEEDLERLGDEPLDVLVTHAAPASVPLPFPPRPLRLPESILYDARRARSLLDEAVKRTGPELILHGHHHMRIRAEALGARVEGLAHDKAGNEDSWAVLALRPTLGVIGS